MSDSLETLLADGVIEAVLGQLKTGKEAEVWLVQHDSQVVAAKLYKERHARNFRNNAGYREGREVRNSRTRRAMEKGSRFGQAAAEDAWKSAEADSLYTLHAQGVRVPTPVMFYEGVLLMELVLDAEGQPAPRLVEAPPTTPEEARALYLDLRAQVVGMLSADLIHGDLSPYNILMSAAGPVIIDFPQTVAAARNNRAEFYFRRDLDNVRTFLAAYDPRLHGTAGDTGEIWAAYVKRELTRDFVPSGTFREAPRRGRNNGPREERRGFREEGFREEGFRQEAAAPAPAVASPEAPELDPVEAELRALEAMVLRQGGGERGKPAAVAPARDGRRRPFGARPGGPRPGGPSGGQRSVGPAGGQRPGGAPGGPRPGGQRSDGQRPGGQRPGGQRPEGNGRPLNGAPRAAGGAQPPQAEMRNGQGGRRPPGEMRNGPRNGPPAGGPRDGGMPRERRGGPDARPPQGDMRNGQGARPAQGDMRNGRPFRGEPRGGGNGQQQGNGRPFAGAPRNGERRPERPAGPGGRPQQPGRGEGRMPRGGPQVMYVARAAPQPSAGAAGPGGVPPRAEEEGQAPRLERRVPGRQ